MSNTIFDAMGGSGQGGNQNNHNFAPALLQYMQGFKGNPIEELQGKLNSGEMTQQQYSQLRGMAENIAQRMMRILPHR